MPPCQSFPATLHGLTSSFLSVLHVHVASSPCGGPPAPSPGHTQGSPSTRILHPLPDAGSGGLTSADPHCPPSNRRKGGRRKMLGSHSTLSSGTGSTPGRSRACAAALEMEATANTAPVTPAVPGALPYPERAGCSRAGGSASSRPRAPRVEFQAPTSQAGKGKVAGRGGGPGLGGSGETKGARTILALFSLQGAAQGGPAPLAGRSLSLLHTHSLSQSAQTGSKRVEAQARKQLQQHAACLPLEWHIQLSLGLGRGTPVPGFRLISGSMYPMLATPY